MLVIIFLHNGPWLCRIRAPVLAWSHGPLRRNMITSIATLAGWSAFGKHVAGLVWQFGIRCDKTTHKYTREPRIGLCSRRPVSVSVRKPSYSRSAGSTYSLLLPWKHFVGSKPVKIRPRPPACLTRRERHWTVMTLTTAILLSGGSSSSRYDDCQGQRHGNDKWRLHCIAMASVLLGAINRPGHIASVSICYLLFT